MFKGIIRKSPLGDCKKLPEDFDLNFGLADLIFQMDDINQGLAPGDEAENAALGELEVEDSEEVLSTVEVIQES